MPIAGMKAEAGGDRPPLEARDIVQRLCDDRRMLAQVEAAINERLRDEGARALGDRLVAHAVAQKPRWESAFYDAYYKVLTNYLEEINYAGTGEGVSQAPNSGATAPGGGVGLGRQTVAQPPAIIPGVGAVAGAMLAEAPVRTRKERLRELKELRDEELISQEEFDARRREILAEV